MSDSETGENSGRIFDVNLDDFDRQVIDASHDHPILVDFWADWCPPCIAIAPILETVVDKHTTDIGLARLEVDEGDNMKIAGRYQVRGFPTIILFQDGEERGRFSGAKSAGFVERFIDESLTP